MHCRLHCPWPRWRLREVRAPAEATVHRMPKARQALRLIVTGLTALLIATTTIVVMSNINITYRPAAEDTTITRCTPWRRRSPPIFTQEEPPDVWRRRIELDHQTLS